MQCETARQLLPLYSYGELTFEQEEALHRHLEECAACSEQFQKWRLLERALERRRMEPGQDTLAASRRELHWRLAAEPSRLAWVVRAFRPVLALRLAGGVALLTVGFLIGRWTVPPGAPYSPAATGEPLATTIRFIEHDPDGQVRIGIEERRERILRGRLGDAVIQQWLLSAAREAADPGLRLDSVDLLRGRAGEEKVRRALLEAVQRDPNPGVRLKALEALKPFAWEPTVRETLARVLLADENPGVRIQAIDLLVQQRRRDELVGLLQEVIHREENDYVRLRCRQALEELRASVGTF
ncbi:MAG: HEAT repeat domain-containing protein [Bryobacterales bacterium]|nr:HEAT repeat domain-containing protein [Bryobacteraceae bacterium]MDW8129373.1 HEAT repeat domain-containing protein [Bryobacterales bacterium]